MSIENVPTNAASSTAPSPALIFETINAYQRSAAIKGAIELNVFSEIAAGHTTSPDLARACQASERGIRILCDYLTILGFLAKSGAHYALTPDSSLFLDRRSPAYMGTAIDFMLAQTLLEAFKDVAAVVRKGGTVISEEGSVAPEHPMWVDFARAMAPMMALPAQLMTKHLDLSPDRPLRLLDIAAGHGLFGIAFAQQHPQMEVTALDWPAVLEVARENAEKAGVTARHHLLPGNAFDVEFGGGYDVVLLTNFLHHFDPTTNETLLRKVYESLSDDGRAVILEFVPNEDRVSPPLTASFSLTMLSSTPSGDAYTFRELETMTSNAGFARSELVSLPPTPQQMVIAYKNA